MVRVGRREELARKGLLACPRQLKYLLDTEKRTKNAMARYFQKGKTKCKGGVRKICKRYRDFNLTHTEGYKKHCR